MKEEPTAQVMAARGRRREIERVTIMVEY